MLEKLKYKEPLVVLLVILYIKKARIYRFEIEKIII